MRAFLNKRAKVKYETVPAAPEVTGDYLAEMIGDSEAIAEAVADTIEANASEILEAGTDFNAGVANIADARIAAADLGDLSDVDTTNERSNNVLMYDAELGEVNKWAPVDPEFNRDWYHLDTVTADGSSAAVHIPLLDTQGMGDPNYQRQLEILVVCELAQGVNDATFGVVFEFYESPVVRRSVGDITNGITAAGKRYINAHYHGDGSRFGGKRLWHGTITNPASVVTSQATMFERLDGYYITALDVAVIECRTTTSGEVIPAGSKFDVYVYAEKFQV